MGLLRVPGKGRAGISLIYRAVHHCIALIGKASAEVSFHSVPCRPGPLLPLHTEIPGLMALHRLVKLAWESFPLRVPSPRPPPCPHPHDTPNPPMIGQPLPSPCLPPLSRTHTASLVFLLVGWPLSACLSLSLTCHKLHDVVRRLQHCSPCLHLTRQLCFHLFLRSNSSKGVQ